MLEKMIPDQCKSLSIEETLSQVHYQFLKQNKMYILRFSKLGGQYKKKGVSLTRTPFPEHYG